MVAGTGRVLDAVEAFRFTTSQLDWLADRPENAPGLAREFLAFFDEARIHGRAGLLQGQQALETVLACGHSGAAEVLGKDVLRLGQVWELYRGVVPRDTVDLKVAAGAGAAVTWPPAEGIILSRRDGATE